ncbi:MAG: 1,4-alpha-glucan branching protein domain-containing protein [Vulcanimicrobiaceae bacterium]
MRRTRDRYARAHLSGARRYFNVVLHAHMPWVKRAGEWPFGEEWFYQAMGDVYLPLLDALARLRAEGVRGALTVGVTPVLLEMLRDPYLTAKFDEYLAARAALLEADAVRSSGPRQRELARDSRDRVLALRDRWIHTYERDLVGALREYVRAGDVEILTGAATHAYLPLLFDDRSVALQLRTGIETTRSAFGVDPAGIWLPECGYHPRLQAQLEALGLRYFYADARAAAPSGASPLVPLRLPASQLAYFASDPGALRFVMDAEDGYPADPAYREFHKRHERSGARYWWITGRDAELSEKDLYDPQRARKRAVDHAAAFAAIVRERTSAASAGAPYMSLAFDAEFFGHWWSEGLLWLEALLFAVRDGGAATFCSPSAYLERHPPTKEYALAASSWGEGGDDRTWRNDATAWMWEELHQMEIRSIEVARRANSSGPEFEQAARELMLAQSSDWTYYATKGGAGTYPQARFATHRDRWAAACAAAGGRPASNVLAEAYRDDSCFQRLDASPLCRVPA